MVRTSKFDENTKGLLDTIPNPRAYGVRQGREQHGESRESSTPAFCGKQH
jgi:hypothetical protein